MTPIYVYIWFDIEDYVTRESDELPLIAFRILEKYGVPVTCKIVAEKIRRLEENGRRDVISAISRYDVGYHLDTHSQHPTLYEYLGHLDILSGAEQFLTREAVGVEKVRGTFSRDPSCFGHPGLAWAPHVYPALAKMRIPVYLDETAILNLDNQPYWYCGVLNLNGANKNFVSFDYTFERADGVEVLKRRFKRIHSALRKKGGGAISVLFHLHTSINR
jgi:peptidoglycan/xylan/chitin deacetylase (PgdA/CDA1 family)